MNQRPEITLFHDEAEALQWLAQWVSHRVIPIADREWSEIHAEFADTSSYATAYLHTPQDEKACLLHLEVGVRWEAQHRATACLVIEWDREAQQLGQLRSALVDGSPSEFRQFTRLMTDYAQLQRTRLDVGMV